MPTGAVGGRGNHVMNHKQSETIIQTLKTMKLQVQMVAMSHLSDVQELIRFGALEQVRRELNFVKSLMLEYPDLEAEVLEERINEIYTRNMADLAKPAGQMDERSRVRQMAIRAYWETCPSDRITGCCDVCDCCAFSQAFVEKFDELMNSDK